MKIELKGATAILQGFGNVGSVSAAALDELGAKIIGVSDLHGAVFNEKGLDVTKLLAHVKAKGSVQGFKGGVAIDARKLLEMPCDLLVPAAAANQITADNAAKIHAKIIAEGANSPTSPEADRILARGGVTVIPDILCNAGGVFVSYLEYTQETQQEQVTEEEVRTRLYKRMTERSQKVWQLAADRRINLREAAMMLAMKTVCQAVTARGYLP